MTHLWTLAPFLSLFKIKSFLKLLKMRDRLFGSGQLDWRWGVVRWLNVGERQWNPFTSAHFNTLFTFGLCHLDILSGNIDRSRIHRKKISWWIFGGCRNWNWFIIIQCTLDCGRLRKLVRWTRCCWVGVVICWRRCLNSGCDISSVVSFGYSRYIVNHATRLCSMIGIHIVPAGMVWWSKCITPVLKHVRCK